MSWLNLLTPSAAVIAIFLAIGLVVQSFRHGRAIRRLEQQIASAGLAAYNPTLDRLKALSGLSDDAAAGSRTARLATRRNLMVAGIVVAVLVVAGGAWALLRHSGSSSGATASTKTTTHPAAAKKTHTSSTATTTTTPLVAAACANATPVSNPSSVTVSVYNGSDVSGAAGKVISPKLSALGYAIGTVANAPTGITTAATSKVEYVGATNLDAACSVATALGVAPSQVAALTLLAPAQAGPSNVVVLVGQDIASG